MIYAIDCATINATDCIINMTNEKNHSNTLKKQGHLSKPAEHLLDLSHPVKWLMFIKNVTSSRYKRLQCRDELTHAHGDLYQEIRCDLPQSFSDVIPALKKHLTDRFNETFTPEVNHEKNPQQC